MTSAPLIEIKRFAVHDGPGIRTTIFLKGCSLHCIWCHNPESVFSRPELALLKNRCTLCGECVKYCSCHSIVNGEHKIDRQRCTGCGNCLHSCLYGALEIYGRQVTATEIAQEILEDRKFYDYSDGGATLSGGEPLLYPEFCAELFSLLKKTNIHTAIDTCGNVPWASFEKVLSVCDLFLYDFKHASSEEHRKLTDCGNELLLKNLRRLAQSGKPIEIRMIMIPTLNMSSADLIAAAETLSELPNITRIKLLPYHSFAASKYEAVGHLNSMPDVLPPSQKEMLAAADIIRQSTRLPVSTG